VFATSVFFGAKISLFLTGCRDPRKSTYEGKNDFFFGGQIRKTVMDGFWPSIRHHDEESQ
jgi:hypothetical protein